MKKYTKEEKIMAWRKVIRSNHLWQKSKFFTSFQSTFIILISLVAMLIVMTIFLAKTKNTLSLQNKIYLILFYIFTLLFVGVDLYIMTFLLYILRAIKLLELGSKDDELINKKIDKYVLLSFKKYPTKYMQMLDQDLQS